MSAAEYNFDGLVGPTHNYAGLAHGNNASQSNRGRISHPKKAALEGLAKMKLLADLGIPQAVLPPQERPDIAALRRLGFTGSDAAILERAAKTAPELLAACCSASSMWAANAATVSPSADCADGRLHITPANLISHLHRSLETAATARILRAIFPGPLFAHHDPLPSTPDFSDEGAANHTRLCAAPAAASPGVELLVYGVDPNVPPPQKINPRQSRLASEAIARLHALNPARTVFARQHPEAIAAGVFHNDVIAVGHRNLFLYHEKAFADGPAVIKKLRAAFTRTCNAELNAIRVPEKILLLKGAVASYLFNSQLVSRPDGRMILLAPTECRENPHPAHAIAWIHERAPEIAEVQYINVRQSMRNGGGPACLRLRILLTPKQQSALHPGVLFTATLHQKLCRWVNRHYRDQLRPQDLADPHLLEESRRALNELTRILHFPNLYDFQR